MTDSSSDQVAFDQMMKEIVSVNGSIGSDTGEWAALAEVASATTIHDYATAASGSLWTDGEDTYSWTIVKGAATTAATLDDHAALMTILSGFTQITAPSHNSDQWTDLSHTAAALMVQVAANRFESVMALVVQLQQGITTDAGEWAAYAQICRAAMLAGVQSYITGCNSLWTDGEDTYSWTMVKSAAAQAAQATTEDRAVDDILMGFLGIFAPSHNADQWAQLRASVIDSFTDDSQVLFVGADTRARRLLSDPDKMPLGMAGSYLIRRDNFPARYTETFGYKTCHVEYFMRLDQGDAAGDAHFLVTHSQDAGGYVGLARVPAANVGTGALDNQVTVSEPQFAGDIVWWDLLNFDHPGGCNHPGNGGQIGSTVVLVGQDWTKAYGPFHAVEPVGKGSKVLFYDFSCLEGGHLPTTTQGSTASNAYLGCLTTEELNLAPGDDGEVSSVVIEQGPDGRFYLIAGNANQTVLWASSQLLPDISYWKQLPIGCASSMNDGSSMLAWATFDGSPQALFWVTSRADGMDFKPLTYLVRDGEVLAAGMQGNVTHASHQMSSQFSGDNGGWVSDNGGFYVGAGRGIALHGAYQSINDSKGPSGQEPVPCIQVRTWYSNQPTTPQA